MSSLVPDYGTDSDSDASGGDSSVPDKVQCQQSAVTVGQNLLITQDESDSSSSEEDTSSKNSSNLKEKLPNPLLEEKLPPPSLGNVSEATKHMEGSVFTNRYDCAEVAKKSVLEKHVKMTEGQFLTGKKAKICRKFKQGRCFYGNNCQYSHDIDSNLSMRYKKDEPIIEDSTSQTSGISGHSSSHPPLKRHNNPRAPQLPPPPRQQLGFMGTPGTLNANPRPTYSRQQQFKFRQQAQYMEKVGEGDGDDDDKFNIGDKRKKRVGVSQTLVPPKKAMANLSRQREEERPWTVHK